LQLFSALRLSDKFCSPRPAVESSVTLLETNFTPQVQRMARFKHYDYEQTKMIPLRFAGQIQKGTFGYTLNHVVDNELDRRSKGCLNTSKVSPKKLF
jgi:carbamate kinase